MSKHGKTSIGLFGLCTLFAASAMADISVSTRAIDDTTGGDWRGKYGSCYSVVPWAPRATFPEYQVGPDFQGDSPEQYIISTIPFEEPNVPLIPPEDAACIAGAATDAFDFRVFTKSSPDPNPGHAFVWGFHEPGSNEGNAVLPNTPQWNACRNIFYPATFDSDLFAYDPMSAEIKLDKGGSATVAFYFLSEYDIYQCRTQDYVLYINGNKEAEGTIKDLTTGVYVVFDIDGLEDNAVIRLDTTDTAGGNDPKNCAPLDADLGPNSHLSGIFIDGTWACDVPPPTLGCRFTGGLKDVFENNHYRAGGQAGANTALQPQPKGEWTHRQQKGPAGKFTFHGGTASAPEGSEIDVIRCSDPGGCRPSGDKPSPAKQLDFDGIGTFKNIGKKNGGGIPDFMDKNAGNTVMVGHGNKNFDGTFHWFEVNIDDLGEPGNTNPKKNPGDGTEACPANGFGEKGDQELANCSCSDFYRITIYDGVKASDVKKNPDGSIDKSEMNTTDVIYEVQGYIDGGNLQLHHLTGFDLK